MKILDKNKRSDRVALQLSVAQMEILEPIGKRIRGHWEEAQASASTAREKGFNAIREALLCGEALIEAKAQLKHGQWLPWLQHHCADVATSIVTAQHWMRLATANKKGIFLLEQANSLTEAYRLVGILPASTPCAPALEGQYGNVEQVNVEQVMRKANWFRSIASAVRQWAPEQKRRFIEEIRPLVELYQELIPSANVA